MPNKVVHTAASVNRLNDAQNTHPWFTVKGRKGRTPRPIPTETSRSQGSAQNKVSAAIGGRFHALVKPEPHIAIINLARSQGKLYDSATGNPQAVLRDPSNQIVDIKYAGIQDHDGSPLFEITEKWRGKDSLLFRIKEGEKINDDKSITTDNNRIRAHDNEIYLKYDKTSESWRPVSKAQAHTTPLEAHITPLEALTKIITGKDQVNKAIINEHWPPLSAPNNSTKASHTRAPQPIPLSSQAPTQAQSESASTAVTLGQDRVDNIMRNIVNGPGFGNILMHSLLHTAGKNIKIEVTQDDITRSARLNHPETPASNEYVIKLPVSKLNPDDSILQKELTRLLAKSYCKIMGIKYDSESQSISHESALMQKQVQQHQLPSEFEAAGQKWINSDTESPPVEKPHANIIHRIKVQLKKWWNKIINRKSPTIINKPLSEREYRTKIFAACRSQLCEAALHGGITQADFRKYLEAVLFPSDKPLTEGMPKLNIRLQYDKDAHPKVDTVPFLPKTVANGIPLGEVRLINFPSENGKESPPPERTATPNSTLRL